MAIVVPFLLSSTAVGTAIGLTTSIAGAIGGALGVGAGLVSTITSVAFQVTGVNDKINKAASKVFGEDLVGVVNIAGAVYGAVNGGFDIGKGAEAAAGLSKATLDGTTDLGFNSAPGAYDVATGGANTLNGLPLAGEPLSKAALDGTNAFGSNSVASPFNLAEQAGVAPDAGAGTNLLDQSQPLGQDTKMLAGAAKAGETPGSGQTGAAAPTASGANATAPKATAGQELKAGNVSQPPASQPPQTTTDVTKPGSIFQKILGNDKALGAVIQGVGGGISAAANSKAEKEKLAWQKQRYTATPTTRILQ